MVDDKKNVFCKHIPFPKYMLSLHDLQVYAHLRCFIITILKTSYNEICVPGFQFRKKLNAMKYCALILGCVAMNVTNKSPTNMAMVGDKLRMMRLYEFLSA